MKNIFKDLDQQNLVSAFHYGSTVYGTNSEDSDLDIILVVKEITDEVNDLVESVKNTENHSENIDIVLYTEEDFKKKIAEHEISVLECLFLNDKHILFNNVNWDFDLDLLTLRRAISEKASNSWVKAKKKFIVEKDFNPYIGLKSAWHSIRILDYGRQIAEHGKILNYQSCNIFFNDVMSKNSWDEVNEEYKSKFNSYSSMFKKFAPK